ncbi:hypothetical protein CKM354_001222900 [Cercospora kikuchii]|uniref:Uncharacterized protein n=1 Tax=Cercospora kikuchii TaxID=84275 RepID=A0A9P3L171_9PEZI|nr:uncharacterized protein CKM354_001222900 [Cercospora kikuchii]GIZ49194.1 hypothetical protein CKM354_001222900 [Cercospora kikuchii]
MAPQLVYESTPEPPAEVWTRELCYEEGDRIIALDDVPENHLVLNSEILGRASLFFKGSQQNDWGVVATTIRHQPTGKDRTVLTYYLIRNSESETLTLTKTACTCFHGHVNELTSSQRPTPDGLTGLDTEVASSSGRVAVFYLSGDAHGFTHRRHHQSRYRGCAWGEDDAQSIYNALDYLAHVRKNHRVMFKLLYKERIEEELYYEDYADIAAYAELYDLLSEIAPALRQLLLNERYIWEDIKKNYHFYIALGRKLECEEVFVDAMRHYIGSGSTLRDLTTELEFDERYALEIAEIRESQIRRVEILLQDIQALTLATHIPDTSPRYAPIGPGRPVKTAFFSSAHAPTHLERVQEIAWHIFREWFTYQQLGAKHHAYVRDNPRDDEDDFPPYLESDDEDFDDAPRPSTSGVYLPGSLRSACNYAVEASQTGKELEIFDENVAEAFVRKSSLAASPYVILEVQSELKKLVNQMANLALPLVAPRDYKLVKAQRYEDRNGTLHFGMHPPLSAKEDYSARGSNVYSAMSAHYGRGSGRGGRGRGFGRGYVQPPQVIRGPGTVRPGTFGYAHTYLSEPEPHIEDHPWFRYGNKYIMKENRYGMTARDDSDIHYFTATQISEDDVPWTRVNPLGVEYEICDLQPASKKWLKALGVLGEDFDDIEESEDDGSAGQGGSG